MILLLKTVALFAALSLLQTSPFAVAQFDPSLCFLQLGPGCFFVQSSAGCVGNVCTWALTDPARRVCSQNPAPPPFICDNSLRSISGNQYGCVCGAALSTAPLNSNCGSGCQTPYRAVVPGQNHCNIAYSDGLSNLDSHGNYTGTRDGACLTTAGSLANGQVIDGYGIAYLCDNTARAFSNSINYVCNCNSNVNVAAVGQSQGNANACNLPMSTTSMSSSPTSSAPAASTTSASVSPYNASLPSSYTFRLEGYWTPSPPVDLNTASNGLAVQIFMSSLGADHGTLGMGGGLTQTGPRIRDNCTRYAAGSGTSINFQLTPDAFMAMTYQLMYIQDPKKSQSQIDTIAAGISVALRFSSVAVSFIPGAAPIGAILGALSSQQAITDAYNAYQQLKGVDCQGVFANRTFALRADQLAKLSLDGSLSHVDMLLAPRLGSSRACSPEPITFVKWTVRCTSNCNGTSDTLASLQRQPLVVDLALPQPHQLVSLYPSSFSTSDFSRKSESNWERRQDTTSDGYSTTYSTSYSDESNFVSSVSSVVASITSGNSLTGSTPSPTTMTAIYTGSRSGSTATATVTFQSVSPNVSTGFEALYDSGLCAAQKPSSASTLYVSLTLLLVSLILGSLLVL